MVRSVQSKTMNRPCEEDALDQAMNSIDPMLQLSLQQEQRRRNRKLFFGGVIMLASLCGILFLVLPPALNSSADPITGASENAVASAAQDKEADERIANIAKAEEISQQGWALWRERKYSKSASKFSKAYTLDPKSEAILNGWGWSLIHIGESKKALKKFEECLSINQSHGGAINGAGQCSMKLGDYEKAETYFRRADKNGGAALYTLAKLELLNGKFDEAKKTIEKADATGQFSAEPMAKSLAKMKSAAEAGELGEEYRKELEAMTGKDQPKTNADAESYRLKGWQMFQQGKTRAAEIAFRECIKVDPVNESGLNGLGFCLLNQGKTSDAQPIFEQLVKLNDKHGGYVNGLARCYAANGEDDKALEMWKTVENESQVTAGTWRIVRTLMKLKRYDEALPYVKRLEAGSPANQKAAIEAWIKECESNSGK